MEDELRQREIEKGKVGNGKVCNQCGIFRDRSEFRPHPRAKDGMQNVCLHCKPTYRKAGHMPAFTPETQQKNLLELNKSLQEQIKQLEKTHLRVTIKSGAAEVTFKCEIDGNPLVISIDKEMEK